jgi:DNA uptake protein ComE-like DNA-binding protein
MKLKSMLAAYFTLTWKDRVALFVLTCIILLVSFAPRLFPPSHSTIRLTSEDSAWLDMDESSSQTIKGNPENTGDEYVYEKSTEIEKDRSILLFPFDPNTLDAAGWQKLGIRERTIQIILNYRNKGGKFRNEKDLAKIWGLSALDFNRLKPYVKILATKENEPTYQHATISTATKKTIVPVDINSADTTAFIALPGIGSKLASRIILFREKLGGFHQVSQVSEVFGLHDSVYQKLRPHLVLTTAIVKKINVNTATLEVLRAHPYIRQKLGALIIHYRNEHGPFSKVEELENIMGIERSDYLKMAPYLTVD